MYHPRFNGSHYEIGSKLGGILRKENIDFDSLIHLDDFQRRHGRQSQKILARIFPEVCEEIRGLTDVLDYDHEKFTTWLLCMGCCYDPKGCTTFCFQYKDRLVYGRNNDLPPFLKKDSKSILYRLENGQRFIGNTSSMIHFEEGLNQFGLAVAMEFIMPTMIVPGINSVFIVRYLLEKCKTVDEGISALQKLPIASACSIILVDRQGNMAVAECSPENIVIRKPEHDRPFIVAANHFVSEEMAAVNSNQVYNSVQRYNTAVNALNNIEHDNGVEHAKAILSGQHGFMCQYHRSLNFETIWSSVFDISNNKIYRAEGDPAKVSYKEDARTVHLIGD